MTDQTSSTRTSRLNKAGLASAVVGVILLAGVGGYAIAGYTAAAPPAAPPAAPAQQAPEAPPAVEAPAEDDWEREYKAQQKEAEREQRRKQWDQWREQQRQQQEFDQHQAQSEKEQDARRAQLPPTSTTLEALLRKSQANSKANPGISTPGSEKLRSDLFWLSEQVEAREGAQAVQAACDRVYGPDAVPHSNVRRAPEGAVVSHEVCSKQSGEFTL